MNDLSGPLAALQDEIATVGQLLQSAVEELQSPLNELVQSHIDRNQSKRNSFHSEPWRTAIILSAGLAEPDTDEQRQQRISLAAALELLHVALRVHQLLVAASHRNEETNLDTSLIGSTILAGDYCFSRAAQLAAQTNSPRVVDRFAQALQVVSEGHLRYLFGKVQEPFDEEGELLQTGVEAAVELANLPLSVQSQVLKLCTELIQSSPSSEINRLLTPDRLQMLSPAQQARWHALATWLASA